MKRRSSKRRRKFLRFGASGIALVRLLEKQAEVAQSSARLVEQLIDGALDTQDARTRMLQLEHEGDSYRRDLVMTLSRALMPPLDREDVFRLSRALDDIVDELRDFVRTFDVFQPFGREPFVELARAIAVATDELVVAMRLIVDDPGGSAQRALATRKASNEVRRQYQSAVAELVHSTLGVQQSIGRYELLSRLDVVGLSVGQAADVLADGAMKRLQ